MADGVTIPASGTGDATPKIATDDAGAAGHVQIIKLAISADGSATVLPATAANGLGVDVTRVAGNVAVTTADGADTALGATTDADTAVTVIGRLKKLVTLLAGGLPAALSSNGGLKVEQVVAGPTQPVSGTVTANAGTGTFGVDANVVATATALASGNITSGAAKLVGFSIRETASTTAVVRLRDTDASGTILTTISLVANESARDWFGPGGINAPTRIYCQIVSGTVEGAVYSK